MDLESTLNELGEDLAIPYVAMIYSIEKEDGEWLCHAEYPELPHCSAEAPDAAVAMAQLEEERVRIILAMHERGELPARPRPALRSGISGLSALPIEPLLRKVLEDRESA